MKGNDDGETNYTRFWRWHFYAALFITPLLITLTLSGIGYLFYTNVENNWYKNEFFNKSSQTQQLTIDQGMEKAKQTFKDYSVSKVIVLEDPYNTRLTMTNKDGDQNMYFRFELSNCRQPKSKIYIFQCDERDP